MNLGSKDMVEMVPGSIEGYARAVHRYHPVVFHVFASMLREFPRVAGFFKDVRNAGLFLRALRETKVHVLDRDSIASGRRYKDENGRGATPCFMLMDHAFWARGVLNKPGRHVGNTFDLCTHEGFAYLLHEVFHVMQWYRSPLWLVSQYLFAPARSIALSKDHVLWAHEKIGFEKEAIDFHQKIWKFLDDEPEASAMLEIFAKFR